MKWIILLLRAVMSHTPLKAGHCFGVTTLGLYNGACSACSFGLSDKSDWEREPKVTTVGRCPALLRREKWEN